MYTMYVEVYEHTSVVSVLCMAPFTWKRLIGKFYNCGISTVRRQIKNPITSRERKFNFLSRDVFVRQVPNISCHNIFLPYEISQNNHSFVFIVNAKIERV